MAPCTPQFTVWTAWHFAKVQLPFCTARSLTFYHLLCDLAAATFPYCLHITGDHLKGRTCSFLLLPPECDGSSGSLELPSRTFDGMPSEGMRELEVALLRFRSLSNVCHFKDARNVMWERWSRIAEGGLWKRASILQHCQGSSMWPPAADHPGIPFGVTSRAGDTRHATFSVFCLMTSFPVPVSKGKRAGTACGSLGSGKTKLQHLALHVLTTWAE